MDTRDPSFSINSSGNIVIGKTGTYYLLFTGGATMLSPTVNTTQIQIGIFIGNNAMPTLSGQSLFQWQTMLYAQ